MSNQIPVVCLDCLTPTVPGPRCPSCERDYQAARNADPKRAAYRSPEYRSAPRGGICHLCGEPGADTLDHVDPLAEDPSGGGPENWLPAHRSCNSSKGRRVAGHAPAGKPAKRVDWWIL
jgi:5-methylcytosine-specific restriction endonuclease McrA